MWEDKCAYYFVDVGHSSYWWLQWLQNVSISALTSAVVSRCISSSPQYSRKIDPFGIFWMHCCTCLLVSYFIAFQLSLHRRSHLPHRYSTKIRFNWYSVTTLVLELLNGPSLIYYSLNHRSHQLLSIDVRRGIVMLQHCICGRSLTF